jgi:hypothetical protein
VHARSLVCTTTTRCLVEATRIGNWYNYIISYVYVNMLLWPLPGVVPHSPKGTMPRRNRRSIAAVSEPTDDCGRVGTNRVLRPHRPCRNRKSICGRVGTNRVKRLCRNQQSNVARATTWRLQQQQRDGDGEGSRDNMTAATVARRRRRQERHGGCNSNNATATATATHATIKHAGGDNAAMIQRQQQRDGDSDCNSDGKSDSDNTATTRLRRRLQ